MGCAIEITDTGVETEVHVFDTKADAEHYVTRSRRYSLTLCIGTDPRSAIAIYTGAVEGECASIRRTPRGETWRACFWIEGNAKVGEAPPVQDKPAYFGYFREHGGEWSIVRNHWGGIVSYASTEAALAGAKFVAHRVQVYRATKGSAHHV